MYVPYNPNPCGLSTGDFRADLQDMMNNAPNEQVRQKLMETMNMM